jgi:hypothetical protein
MLCATHVVQLTCNARPFVCRGPQRTLLRSLAIGGLVQRAFVVVSFGWMTVTGLRVLGHQTRHNALRDGNAPATGQSLGRP